jgi:cell division protease FtsH
MSDILGPVLYAENSGEVFLGKSVTQNKNISEETARLVDSEIKRLVTTAYEQAKDLLVKKKKEWETLSNALIEYETLTGEEIKDVVAGKPISKSEESPVDEEHRTQSSIPEL